MTRHIRGLSQRARLAEFVFSESGAMNAKKAAQMGAILGASVLAGLLMNTGTAEAHSCHPCMVKEDCAVHQLLACTPHVCNNVCGSYCTNSTIPTCP